MPAENKTQITTYIDAHQNRTLRLLSAHTDVPFAVYVRRGLDMVIAHEADTILDARHLEAERRRMDEAEANEQPPSRG